MPQGASVREQQQVTRIAGLLVGGAVIALDQWSKALALASPLAAQSTEILPFLNLVLVRNRGVTFGMLNNGIVPWWGLSLLAMAVVAWLGAILVRETRIWPALGLGAVIGGAIGNVIDRWRHRAVTDFIDLHLNEWHWPSFNIADVAVVVGITLVVIGMMRRSSP